MTPPEIVAWLNQEYWGDEYEIRIEEKELIEQVAASSL